jgi:hypothetical protein
LKWLYVLVLVAATAQEDGFVPLSGVNWNDSDNSNAFHSKQIVMDVGDTIPTEVATTDDRQDYEDNLTMGLPLSKAGTPFARPGQQCLRSDPERGEGHRGGKRFLKV